MIINQIMIGAQPLIMISLQLEALLYSLFLSSAHTTIGRSIEKKETQAAYGGVTSNANITTAKNYTGKITILFQEIMIPNLMVDWLFQKVANLTLAYALVCQVKMSLAINLAKHGANWNESHLQALFFATSLKLKKWIYSNCSFFVQDLSKNTASPDLSSWTVNRLRVFLFCFLSFVRSFFLSFFLVTRLVQEHFVATSSKSTIWIYADFSIFFEHVHHIIQMKNRYSPMFLSCFKICPRTLLHHIFQTEHLNIPRLLFP